MSADVLDPPFDAEEYAARLTRVQRAMRDRGIDTLLVTSPEGMCYLHGYQARWYRAHSSTAWLPLATTVVRADAGMVHFDFERERALLADCSVAAEVRFFPGEGDAALEYLAQELASMGWLDGVTGLEHWSYVPNRAVSEREEAALVAKGARTTDASDILRGVRRIKSPAELRHIEAAAVVADAGLSRLWKSIAPGRTELELWAEMMDAMIGAGGEPAAAHELVTTKGLGRGHALSGRAQVMAGDTVIADPCGVVHRYHANTCRTFSMGPPSAVHERAMEIAGGAVEVLCKVAVVGTPYDVVNRTLREYYKEHGLWEGVTWAGGYELGLSLSPDWVGQDVFDVADRHLDDQRVVEAGTVTSFHSNFELPYVDTVVFDVDGTRALSTLPRRLLVVA